MAGMWLNGIRQPKEIEKAVKAHAKVLEGLRLYKKIIEGLICKSAKATNHGQLKRRQPR